MQSGAHVDHLHDHFCGGHHLAGHGEEILAIGGVENDNGGW